MKTMDVILKATESCNMRCRYCYNCDSRYASTVLPMELLEKLFRMLASSCTQVSIVWHGGEPLLCGKDYMRQALALQRKIFSETGTPFDNSLQTNGTLIDPEWLRLFDQYKVKLGISFDGLTNERYRQQTDQVLKVIRELRKKKVRFGCLAVVADDDYDMIANYQFFSSLGIGFSLSPMFAEGGGESLPALNAEGFARKLNALFDHWLYDTKGVNVRVFTDYLTMLFGGSTRVCTHGSCHGKWLGVDPEGNLYNCGRDSLKKYCFGNLKDLDSLSEAFSSEGFRNLLVGAITRRQTCKDTCDLFPFCQSGCSDCAITENGLEHPLGFSCACFKTVFTHVRDVVAAMQENHTPLSSLNPSVRMTALRCMSEKG